MTVEFAIRGDYIQLDQLLKATAAVSSGGQAHAVTTGGEVTVDGLVETRKRAKLRPGQRVHYAGHQFVLVAANP